MEDSLFFEELRRKEFSRLDDANHAYLDYTGSGLYAASQIEAHADRLRSGVFGNPHSENHPSRTSTALIEDARSRLLSFLDASPDDYVVCFTANTTSAIKLVAESFDFSERAHLILSADNHNSVNGIREYARAQGAEVNYLALDSALRIDCPSEQLSSVARHGSGLFAFPAQSNFSGVRHPLGLIETARQLGYSVLLDAAAFLPANKLSLTKWPADFVVLSAYKIAGYPTGVGALVARRSALALLRRPWFSGGTVEYASVQHGTHLLRNFAEGFEDGTPAFLSIAALADGLCFLDEVGMSRVSSHVNRMAEMLLGQLHALRHCDGGGLVEIYGPDCASERGGTIAFNIRGKNRGTVPFADVVDRARESGVSFRGGCFCNPGASEAAFGFDSENTAWCFESLGRRGFSVERFADCLGNSVPVGAVRASVGIATNQSDIERAVKVIASFA